MSDAHLERLRRELERQHWVVVSEHPDISEGGTLHWRISRPNGDAVLILEFHPGYTGRQHDIQVHTIADSIGCRVAEHSCDVDLYFGKLTGQFEKDVVAFVDAIARLEASLRVGY